MAFKHYNYKIVNFPFPELSARLRCDAGGGRDGTSDES